MYYNLSVDKLTLAILDMTNKEQNKNEDHEKEEYDSIFAVGPYDDDDDDEDTYFSGFPDGANSLGSILNIVDTSPESDLPEYHTLDSKGREVILNDPEEGFKGKE
jgi:hypothetical protein